MSQLMVYAKRQVTSKKQILEHIYILQDSG